MRFLPLLLLFLLAACHQEKKAPLREANTTPLDVFYQQRTYPSGRMNQRAMQAATRAYVTEQVTKANDQAWEQIGPYDVGGRITNIQVRQFENGNESIFIGAASGGIFRSDDNTASWDAIFDEQPSLAIGTIALSPHDQNTLFVGTGEINGGGGSIAYEGTGVYKSTDNGNSWTHLGLDNSASIGGIAIHPTNPDIMFVATMGTLFEESNSRGIYRTTDGGATWEKVLYRNPNTGGVNVLIDPTNPDILLATMWERKRRPNNRQYYGPESGLYRSEDGGDTWTELNLVNGELSKISIVRAPSDPNVVYASVVDENLELAGVFKSTDSGQTFAPVTLAGNLDLVTFEYWFNEIFVDPTDPDVLHRLGFTPRKIDTDGGIWQEIFAGVHVDQHSYWMDPTNPQRILLGNDGGLFTTTSGGQSYEQVTNLPITQCYAIEVDPDDENIRYFGSQDNSTWGSIGGDPTDFTNLSGGDGFRIRVEPGSNPTFYTEFQYGNIYRFDDFGRTFLSKPSGPYNWNTPIELDPATPSTIYTAHDRVIRSTNRGNNWETISPSLAGSDAEYGNLNFNSIYALGISAAEPGTIWAGLDNGRLWVTTNNGNNWTDVSTDLPQRWVTSVLVHPSLSQTAYVTFSGFRWNEDAAHVYKTTDNGATWTSLEANLPDVPVNEIVLDAERDHLYLATDVGVYRSDDDGQSWQVFGTGMPALVVRDLTIHPLSDQIFAGTYGRSMFATSLGDPLAVNENVRYFEVSIYPNPATDNFTLRFNLQRTETLDISLFDLQGRLVKSLGEHTFSEGQQERNFKVANLAKGSYAVRVVGADGSAWGERVILQ